MGNKKLILLAVLSVAAAASLLYGILTPSPLRRGARGAPVAAPAPAAEAPSGEPDSGRVARMRAEIPYESWGRNPFARTGTGYGISGLVLNGIAWDKENPKAIVNDNIVGVGDKVAGNTVVAIKRAAVILSDGSREFELKLRAPQS